MTRISLVLVTLVAGALTGVAAPGQAQTAFSPSSSSIAQVPGQAASPAPSGPRSNSQYVLVHVNSASGSDSQGNGSQMQPFKTISYALENASAGTVVLLAPGEYSEATGESFPIQLRSGVTVQGTPSPGQNVVVIRGGGSYLSPSQGLRSVALLTADQAGLGNVVVSNPYTQGYGVWIESGSPVLRDNVFAQSGQSGVFIAGPGTPSIQRNYFTANGVAGLIIGGPSQAEVQGNVFENTGIGIQVAPGATPRLSENRIVQNQDGLILQANARPVLENNVIAHNRRNGLIEFQSPAQTEVLSVTPPTQAQLPVSTGAPVAANSGNGAELEPVAPAAAAIALNPAPATSQRGPQATLAAASTPAAAIAATPPVRSPGAVVAAPSLSAVVPTPQPTPPPTSAVEVAPPVNPPVAAVNASTPAPAAEAAQPTVPPARAQQPQPEQIASLPEVPAVAPVAASLAESAAASGQAVDPAQPSALPNAASPVDAPSQPPSEAAAPSPRTNNLAAARARILAGRQAQSMPLNAAGGPDSGPSTGAVEIAVIPPAAPTNAAAPASPPRGNLAALRERIAQNRAANASSPAESTPSPVNGDGTAIAVVPPPVDAVAQANVSSGSAAAALPLIPTQASLPNVPQANVPTLPPPTGGLSLLQVPGPDIPMGSGGSALPDVLVSSNPGGGPPAPPSRSSSLGLHYKVFIPAADEAAQNRVRAAVPDAFRVRMNGQVMMQAGAYPDQATADEIATNLIQQGLDAKVQYVP